MDYDRLLPKWENNGKRKRKNRIRITSNAVFRDSHRTQTCNLLIRSQMLYSIELGSRNIFLFLGGFGLLGVVALLDAGLLAGEIAEVEDASPAYLAVLVDSDAVDEG